MGLLKVNTHGYLTKNTPGYMFRPMKNQTIAERLELAMKEGGMTQAQLAEAAGVAQPTIFKILSGKTNKSSYIVQIAKALNVRPEWLDMNEGPMRNGKASEHDGIDPGKVVSGAFLVPLWDGESKTPNYIAAPTDIKSEGCRAYILKRSSGYPEASEGDVIVVDVNESAAHNDFVYAKINGSDSVYKFIPDAERGLLATSDPRAPLISIGENASIIGVVVYIGKKFNR
ncbi:TPA: helix-turn-helix domain-containing protein [Klebsiella quasipneumoniae subsp. similipneumoniae]|nr:helix-turn-helix domain-containing protein [Klebsiella quasipneumoniae subsp. similipneumoniae]